MDAARVSGWTANEEILELWVLLKIALDGEWVAGDLVVSKPGMAALMEVGIKDADPRYVNRGAVQAAYWFSLEYLRDQGHRWVNLMFSRPFLRNGVLQYKLRFSPTLGPKPADGFLIIPDTGNDAAREIQLQQPFLAWGTAGLEVAWFTLDPNDKPNRIRVPIDISKVEGIAGFAGVVLPRSLRATTVADREPIRAQLARPGL